MRHRKKNLKLGRTSSHRKATLSNIAKAIVEHHQIKTTLVKAKAARIFVERLITYGKKNTVAARRLAFKVVQNHQIVKKLFDEIAPTYSERAGGYTRIIKLGRRKGDGAEVAILQLVGFEPLIIDDKKSSAKKKTKDKTKDKTIKEPKEAEIKATEQLEEKSIEKKIKTKEKTKSADKDSKKVKKTSSSKKSSEESGEKKRKKEEPEKK